MAKLRKTRLLLSFILLTLAALHARASDALPPVSFQISGQSVHTAGLTPGGSAVVICAWKTSSGDLSRASESWRETRASESGEAAVAFTSAIPDGAFIAVLDIASGRIRFTSGEATHFEQVSLLPKRLRRDGDGGVTAVLSPHEAVLLVVMRPGEGVWARTAQDGAAGDADHSLDGRITTDPAGLELLAGSGPAPKKIKARDVVLLIDTSSRLFASTEVMP